VTSFFLFYTLGARFCSCRNGTASFQKTYIIRFCFQVRDAPKNVKKALAEFRAKCDRFVTLLESVEKQAKKM
ncbi:MAG: hypothetical protein D3924_01690, partial [Candidatus Electrothrix sp. AR4]|nr:hypothetical protein [Candidatus Electrothrix sp. AR4]